MKHKQNIIKDAVEDYEKKFILVDENSPCSAQTGEEIMAWIRSTLTHIHTQAKREGYNEGFNAHSGIHFKYCQEDLEKAKVEERERVKKLSVEYFEKGLGFNKGSMNDSLFQKLKRDYLKSLSNTDK